jgi:hypothetical protein
VVVGVVRGADGSVFGSGVLAAPVGDAGIAEVAEAEGVVAAFGEELAAEAEHVRPAAELPVTGVATEGPAGVDEPFGVGVGLGNTIRVVTCFSVAAQVGKAAT